MSKSTRHQASFLGGQWSTLSQGRSDLPAYATAMNVAVNAIVVEEGACVRRSGTEWIAPTNGRSTAKLLPFESSSALPYLLEFTNGNLQFYYNTGHVCTNDERLVTASTMQDGLLYLTLDMDHGWSVGDTIVLGIPGTIAATSSGQWKNRVFMISTAPATNSLLLSDDIGGTFPFDMIVGDLNTTSVFRIARLTTPWTTVMLPNLRAVQAQTQQSYQTQSFILTSAIGPQVLNIAIPTGNNTDPVFSLGSVTFNDGPYLDPNQVSGVDETATVSAYTGTITLTPAATTFTASDVGRLVRLFSQPAAWASGTTYTNGQTVTDSSGAWWQFVYSSGLAGVTPGTSTTISGVAVVPWAPAPTAGQWAWGTISAQAGTSCTVVLTTELLSANGTTLTSFQLGVYKSGQYPTCGINYEGRLCLGGALPNRFDMSQSNGVLSGGIVNMSPTDINGIVYDTSAISETLNSSTVNQINWFAADHAGLLCGTIGGEWLIAASQLNDPLTPTSIQAHQITKYQSNSVEPRRCGMALIFIQRYGQRVLEYLADAFSGKFSARHLNEFSKDLTAPGVIELAYQEEKAPIVWLLNNDGTLCGITYRRVSRFITEAPVFAAAHTHSIGDGNRYVQSMCVLPGADGLSDLLYVCTYSFGAASDELTPGIVDWAIEVFRPIFEDA